MKIIIPMAGRGSRLRPHTLTVPKPLIPIAGKPIVRRLVEDLTSSLAEEVDEVAFITGDFGSEVDRQLERIASDVGAKASIYRQDEPLGTAHAILCAEESLTGRCIIAFADTLFNADFNFDPTQDGIIWVKKVEDPSAFGVVKVDGDGIITDFVEKSPEFISDLAIVGLYYVRDGDQLKKELQYLIDHGIKDKGEYQLTNALENMKEKGTEFRPSVIEEWLDCGNKDNALAANHRMLEIKQEEEQLVHSSVVEENSLIIPPCYIGENVVIRNSIVGPYVSIGSDTKVFNSVISESLIQNQTTIEHANLSFSMVGNKVEYREKPSDISIGDFTEIR
ncbi:MAG: sugar phosphate nucleotidyltransferase [Saprospiraceae bacterium]|nr:sugar phosphate nucleotidyltransferase [Saprospiraceae bacterium]